MPTRYQFGDPTYLPTSTCCCTGTQPGTGTCDCSDDTCAEFPTRFLTISGTTDCDGTITLTCDDSGSPVVWGSSDPFGDSNGFPAGPCLPIGTYIWRYECAPYPALIFEPAVGLGTPISFPLIDYQCDPFFATFDLSDGLINVNLCCDFAGAVVGTVTN